MIKKYLDFDKFEKENILEPKNERDYKKIFKFEKQKYKKFVKILSRRLNKIHNKNYNIKFWNKILFFFLIVHITQCYRIFRSLKNIRQKKIYITKFGKFNIPNNQKEHRNLFHRNIFGQEKLFSTLILEQKKFIKLFKFKKDNSIKKKIKIKKKTEIKFYKNFLLRIINYLIGKVTKPKILVSKCYWSHLNLHKLRFKFLGKIETHNFYVPFKEKNKIFENERNYLSNIDNKYDKFDKFFFKTLKYSLPMSFIENFSFREKYTQVFLKRNRYKKLKFILNENLDEDNLLLNAVSSQKKIKNFYVEHNFLHHFFIGNYLDLILENFDKYITNGWGSKTNKKIIKGGTLSHVFDFSSLKKSSNPKNIYFLCGLPASRYPFTASFYSDCGYKKSISTVNNFEKFFLNLNSYNKKNIFIKRHPESYGKIISEYNGVDQSFLNNKNLKKNIINTDDKFFTLLENTRLAITAYYGTTFLQAIMFNVPVVLFYNRNSCYLKKSYKKYFENFSKVGIIQKSPKDAAIFVNKISKNPEIWWRQEKVQKVRKKFLDENINNVKFNDVLYKLTKSLSH